MQKIKLLGVALAAVVLASGCYVRVVPDEAFEAAWEFESRCISNQNIVNIAIGNHRAAWNDDEHGLRVVLAMRYKWVDADWDQIVDPAELSQAYEIWDATEHTPQFVLDPPTEDSQAWLGGQHTFAANDTSKYHYVVTYDWRTLPDPSFHHQRTDRFTISYNDCMPSGGGGS